MKETFDLIDEVANFTSAGTSQLSVNTAEGLEPLEIENLSELDSDYKYTDLGQLYADFPDNFAKIQKINFRGQFFFNCYFISNSNMDILKFDKNGTFIGESQPQL
ncbi:hypothetical protein ACFQ0R_10635 [Psychroflexus salinarum]|uniref:Pentapeptide repeat-containing protein n=1 Tax=Psychroflexus salinarum TaxID=546024 RepID=A0ABW3GSK1_9FLAO